MIMQCFQCGKKEVKLHLVCDDCIGLKDLFIKKLKEGLNNDWEFCKKANVEPHIHPRRILEFIDKLAGKSLI
jgi:NMD protein affecting ribosome stability and mRNA decay